MSKPGFRLTRHAALALRGIYVHSVEQWGQKKADEYMAAIYAAMDKAAAKPGIGRLRTRAAPFMMIPAGRHFVVYDRLKRDIVILALLHQHRDIECIIANMEPAFLAEIEALRKGSA